MATALRDSYDEGNGTAEIDKELGRMRHMRWSVIFQVHRAYLILAATACQAFRGRTWGCSRSLMLQQLCITCRSSKVQVQHDDNFNRAPYMCM